jgi:hypothetical protein
MPVVAMMPPPVVVVVLLPVVVEEEIALRIMQLSGAVSLALPPHRSPWDSVKRREKMMFVTL